MKPVVILQHEPDDPPGSIRFALRRLKVPYEIRRLDCGDPVPEWPRECSALMSLGGAMHVTQDDQFPFLAAERDLMRVMLEAGAPLWGICLGAQLLTQAADGEVYRRDEPEVGWVEIERVADDPLLRGLDSPFTAFAWHEYSCKLPPRAVLTATRPDGVQVYRLGERAWATQFHPEVDKAMAPHWVRDAVKERTQLGEAFASGLRADTERLLPGYRRFCHILVRNFLLTSNLLPADA